MNAYEEKLLRNYLAIERLFAEFGVHDNIWAETN
jgi:hypothetical protein